MVRLCGHYRLARMLEREDFRSRLEKNQPISVHELLYPLLTGLRRGGAGIGRRNRRDRAEIQPAGAPRNSARIRAAVGSGADHADSGRARRRAQNVEEPRQLRGHHRSAGRNVRQADVDFRRADVVVLRAAHGFCVAGDRAAAEEVRTGVLHPKKAKMQLAHTIIAGFHGEEAAKKAAEEFQRVFSDRKLPEHAIECRIKSLVSGTVNITIGLGNVVEMLIFPVGLNGNVKLAALLVPLADIPSKSEAERLIKQGGVEINGQRVDDVRTEVNLVEHGEFLLRVGKRKFLRVVVE